MKLAPLHPHAHDLAVWLHERAATAKPEHAATGLPADVAREARLLLGHVGVALTFPARRLESLAEADACAVRLRMWLRLGESIGWLSEGGRRHAVDAVDAIGRMLGGWQRTLGGIAAEPHPAHSRPR